jgi:hypothetical protein
MFSLASKSASIDEVASRASATWRVMMDGRRVEALSTPWRRQRHAWLGPCGSLP